MNISRYTIRDTRYAILILAGIIVLTIILYAKSVHNGFVWDDYVQIINNPDIKALSSYHIIKFFSNYYIGMYQPLTSLSYAVEYYFFALDSKPYHIDSLIIHLLNIILVYLFIYSLTKKLNISAFVALFFGIHPMNVEDIAWISARSSIMYTFFFLSGLITYIYYLKDKAKSEERKAMSKDFNNLKFTTERRELMSSFKNNLVLRIIQNSKFYFLCFFLFILSLLSKSSAVIFPLALLLIDYLKGNFIINSKFTNERSELMSSFKNNVALRIIQNLKLSEKLPFFIIAIIFGIIGIYARKSAGLIYIPPVFSIFDRIFLVSYSISFYLIKLFIPAGLCFLHPYPIKSSGMLPAEYYLSAVFITGILISVILIKSSELKKDLIFGLLFYLITIALVSQIIPVRLTITSEHYAYIPYIGLLFIIGSFYNSMILRFKDSKINLPIFQSLNLPIFFLFALRCSLFAYLVFFSVLTYQRIKVWNDGITLFTDVIEKHPDESLSYNSIGWVKLKTGDFKGALEDFNQALTLNPDNEDAYNNRGWLKANMQDFQGALQDFNIAISLNPLNMIGFYARGLTKCNLLDYRGALEDLNNAIALNPNFAKAIFIRGNVYFNLKDTTSACEDWNSALKLGWTEAQNNIALYCKK